MLRNALLTTFFVLLANIGFAGTVILPKTGQQFSYYPGDDGSISAGVSWPEPRFTDHLDGTVTDDLTGLMWTRHANLPGQALKWSAALRYVSEMNKGTYHNFGWTDWRLPNVRELETLIDHGNTSPALPLDHPFEGIEAASPYWSATTVTSLSALAWFVDVGHGGTGKSAKIRKYPIWPVRSGTTCAPAQVFETGQGECYDARGELVDCEGTGQDGEFQRGLSWQEPRFRDRFDGTVVDTLTGLMWTKDANVRGGTMAWAAACEYVADMNAGRYPNRGYTDWRLPNLVELRSLLDYGNPETPLPPDHPFDDVQASYYWTTTSSAANPATLALSVRMSIGDTYTFDKANYCYVWPVRGVFTWPVRPHSLSASHYGYCHDWRTHPRGCFWLSESNGDVNGVWRDAQPFQMHLYRGHFHLGADFNRGGADMDRGQPVYPAADGVVTRVVENECGWGNIVFLRHDMPFGVFTTMYAHVDWLETGPPPMGMYVRLDQPICNVGDGYWNNQECDREKEGCYPCHLHFELRLGDDTTIGLGYSSERVEIGPQGQVDPNAFIIAH